MKIKYSIFYIVFLISLILFGQNLHPHQQGEKIIEDKILKYHKIDTLSNDSPIKAIRDSKALDYKILLNEGEISSINEKKGQFGKGGFTIYKFIEKETKNVLKLEYNRTIHSYKDKNLKDHVSSEVQRITIFFNENNEPDFAKVLEVQYISDKVIASELYYFLNSTNKCNFLEKMNE